jgi:hypothetical protein
MHPKQVINYFIHYARYNVNMKQDKMQVERVIDNVTYLVTRQGVWIGSCPVGTGGKVAGV